MRATLSLILVSVCCLAACSACDRDTPPPDAGNNLNNDVDGGMDGDMNPDPNPDGEPDGECGTDEALCDGECVGVMDDVAHCGGCDACPEGPENTVGSCVQGECVFECEVGAVDVNEDIEGDGCECLIVNEGEELCDGVDNDCDGDIDAEDDDLSPSNCEDLPGAAFSACEMSACVFECREGFEDENMDLGQEGSDGCECQRGVELCDGVDNDCDGDIDADDDELSLETCAPVEGASPSSCVEGACQYGCDEGLADANGDLGQGADGDGCECAPTDPLDEVCDGLDNDCDGDIDADDDGLSLATCAEVDGAEASGCVEGACEYRCLAGFVDINGDLDQGTDGNGCECQQTEPVDEVCDGVDNDCDGDIDGDDDDFAPTLCAEQQGVCEGSVAICDGGNEQICDEDLYLEHDPLFSGLPNSFEVLCDGADNNCDGQDDELCCGQDEGDFLLAEPLVENTRQILPAVAVADSGEIFVAWQESSDNDSDDVADTGVIRWAIVGRDGQIVAGPQTVDEGGEDIQPAVAFDGEAFVLVWVNESANDTLRWSRIETNGTASDPGTIVIDVQNQLTLRDPVLVGLGSGNVLLAWSQRQGCDNTQATNCIRMQTVAQNGLVVVDSLIEVSEPSGLIEARTPSIVLKEDRGLITWHNNALSQLAVGWVLLDAQNVPTGEIRSSTLNAQNLGILPTSAPTPDGFLLAFADSDDNTLQIHTLNLDNNAISVGEPVSITSGGDDKTHPQLAALDDGLALVWVEDGNTVELNSLDLNGAPEPDNVSVLQAGTLGFRPVALAPIPLIGTAILHSSAPQFPPERLLFSILNAQGDRLCFGQE